MGENRFRRIRASHGLPGPNQSGGLSAARRSLGPVPGGPDPIGLRSAASCFSRCRPGCATSFPANGAGASGRSAAVAAGRASATARLQAAPGPGSAILETFQVTAGAAAAQHQPGVGPHWASARRAGPGFANHHRADRGTARSGTWCAIDRRGRTRARRHGRLVAHPQPHLRGISPGAAANPARGVRTGRRAAASPTC